jgi:hypothetical protein
MTYQFTQENQGIKLYEYVGDEEIIVIPDEIDGQKVVSLADNLFIEKDSLKEVHFPKSLKVIPKSICCNCKNLTTITFPHDLEIISEGAFDHCISLKQELHFPKTLKRICSFAFRKCEQLFGDLIIPKSVLHIGIYAFNGCSNLDGYLIYNELSLAKLPIICDRLSNKARMTDGFHFHGTNLTHTRLRDVLTAEEQMGHFIKDFIKETLLEVD